VEAIAGKIVSEHGDVTAVVTILHDRTQELERDRLYEQLKRASGELEQKVREATAELSRQNELLRRSHFEIEQASAAKSQFLANMSHEFRTPLNAILGYTSMLLKGVTGELTPHQRRNLERVDSNSHHLLAIINDILDISRIEAGKMPLTATTFGLKDLVAEVLAEVEPIIARSQLAVTSHVVPELPQLRTDRQKIKQIVINFLTNAIKFTPHGSVDVRTAYDAQADEVAISVADTGIGIAPDDRERIFEDFRQADNSPTREYTGAGLGLAICRRLAGIHADRAARGEAGVRPRRSQPAKEAKAGAPPRSPLVLIVDDFADNREMYTQFLTFSGLRVEEAQNGHEALDKAFALAPDLIVMDLSLPGMDGWEATRRLKADSRTRAIPVIALTGHALAGHSKGAMDAGCDAFITKPCLPERLLEEITSMLKRHPDATERGR
jgi:signal transduction histidine kinase/CheY-like chemotaxis protein